MIGPSGFIRPLNPNGLTTVILSPRYIPPVVGVLRAIHDIADCFSPSVRMRLAMPNIAYMRPTNGLLGVSGNPPKPQFCDVELSVSPTVDIAVLVICRLTRNSPKAVNQFISARMM